MGRERGLAASFEEEREEEEENELGANDLEVRR